VNRTSNQNVLQLWMY